VVNFSIGKLNLLVTSEMLDFGVAMKRSLILLLLAAACFVNATAQSGRRGSVSPAESAPIQPSSNPEPEIRPTASALVLPELRAIPDTIGARQIKGLDNTSFRLADFRGRVVVINLWASWCGPCRREIPEYEKVRKSYQGKNVEFIGLTVEDPRSAADRVNKFLHDVSFGFRLGWADRETARTLMNGRTAIPQTYVIDGEGRVVSHWNGYAVGQSGSRLKQTIEEAIKESRR
jgi:thiol-disulfide isomerase/thioredoxin